MRLTVITIFMAALISSGYAQSPPDQPRAKKQSVNEICTQRLDTYGLRGSLRRKYWWYCWRRRGK
jgi:hypothetical protein